MTQQDDAPYKDIEPGVDVAEAGIKKEESATDTPRETFMTTKQSSHGSKSRSKNRQKGKHTTGSFRS